MSKLVLSWSDFDRAVASIACDELSKKVGVFGVPRGGLVLSVAISHRLNIKWLQTPFPDAMIVDDVVETGRTLDRFRFMPDIRFWTWVAKDDFPHVRSVFRVPKTTWVVFPWESAERAEIDMGEYAAR